MEPGKLYLVPTPLSDQELSGSIHLPVLDRVKIFIVEEIRTARRFLKKAGISAPIESLIFHELNEHTAEGETIHFLDEILNGKDIALLSEAGVPCVADPGFSIVRMAHQKKIQVIPLVGPSSILLALMASGLNGQQFIFHGYLPVKTDERHHALRALEKDCIKAHRTQIFIEAPYRNNSIIDSILKTCQPDLLLTIACDLTTPEQYISTRPVREWKKDPPDLNRRPAVFLLGV